jgi:molybdenum cofactor biosynthesis enzyme MoaA
VSRSTPGEVATRSRYRDGAGEIWLIASVTQPFCGAGARARLSAGGKLSGRRPSATRVIRARMAVAAVKEGTMAALMSGHGKLADSTRLDVLEAAIAVLDAGGQSSH